MKRGIFIALFVLVILMSWIVSAQSLEQVVSNFLSAGEGIIRFLVGDVSGISGASEGEVFFIKVLVFILILALVSLVLQRVPMFYDKQGLSVIVSIIVSLLAVRFITTEGLINFIWLPYGVLGVVLSSFLPFVIGFYFIESFDSTIIRKLGWVAFIVIFSLLAVLRWDDLRIEGGIGSLGWIYLIIALISLLLLIFDKDIHAMLVVSGLSKSADRNSRMQVAQLSHEIAEAKKLLGVTSDPVSIRHIREGIRDKKRRIKTLLRS
jgi:hypothetical protein